VDAIALEFELCVSELRSKKLELGWRFWWIDKDWGLRDVGLGGRMFRRRQGIEGEDIHIVMVRGCRRWSWSPGCIANFVLNRDVRDLFACAQGE